MQYTGNYFICVQKVNKLNVNLLPENTWILRRESLRWWTLTSRSLTQPSCLGGLKRVMSTLILTSSLINVSPDFNVLL